MRSNQATQRTTSQPAICLHSRFACVARFTGLAVADLILVRLHHKCGRGRRGAHVYSEPRDASRNTHIGVSRTRSIAIFMITPGTTSGLLCSTACSPARTTSSIET
jgi:hypothetical protein